MKFGNATSQGFFFPPFLFPLLESPSLNISTILVLVSILLGMQVIMYADDIYLVLKVVLPDTLERPSLCGGTILEQ